MRTKLHAMIEDCLLTRPLRQFKPTVSLTPDQAATADCAVASIEATGGYNLGQIVDADTVRRMQAAIHEAFSGATNAIRLHENPDTGIAQILNPLMLCADFLSFAMMPLLSGIAERYLRRPVVLADVDLRRVPPLSMAELDQRLDQTKAGYTSSHWHRDIRGRQVKAMLYLSDVTEVDSNFAYLPGTHHILPLRARSAAKSRFTDAYVEKLGIKPIECYAPAGTVMIFDTNFIHRLRRKSTAAMRDTFMLYFTPGQEQRPLDYRPEDLLQREGYIANPSVITRRKK